MWLKSVIKNVIYLSLSAWLSMLTNGLGLVKKIVKTCINTLKKLFWQPFWNISRKKNARGEPRLVERSVRGASVAKVGSIRFSVRVWNYFRFLQWRHSYLALAFLRQIFLRWRQNRHFVERLSHPSKNARSNVCLYEPWGKR